MQQGYARVHRGILVSHLDLNIDVKQHCHDHSSLGRLVLQSEVARHLSPSFGPADWIQPFITKVAVALLRICPSYVAILTGLGGSENVLVGEGEDRNALRYKPHKHLPCITDELTGRSIILALLYLLPREAQEHGNIILSPWYTRALEGLERLGQLNSATICNTWEKIHRTNRDPTQMKTTLKGLARRKTTT